MTIQFPNTGSFSFTDLTLPPITTIGTPFNRAFMTFQLSSLPPPPGVSVDISNIVLRGDGITNTLSLPNVTLSSASAVISSPINLDTIADPWNPANSIVSFNIQINGGSLLPDTIIRYRVFYQEIENNIVINSIGRTGDILLIAVTPQNTFGLPADVVALITSRFGSVANFLRLKNQGYV
jgi:hypothetical protein